MAMMFFWIPSCPAGLLYQRPYPQQWGQMPKQAPSVRSRVYHG